MNFTKMSNPHSGEASVRRHQRGRVPRIFPRIRDLPKDPGPFQGSGISPRSPDLSKEQDPHKDLVQRRKASVGHDLMPASGGSAGPNAEAESAKLDPRDESSAPSVARIDGPLEDRMKVVNPRDRHVE